MVRELQRSMRFTFCWFDYLILCNSSITEYDDENRRKDKSAMKAWAKYHFSSVVIMTYERISVVLPYHEGFRLYIYVDQTEHGN